VEKVYDESDRWEKVCVGKKGEEVEKESRRK
jgi:hypothetical protein